jgi:hypothetical protein
MDRQLGPQNSIDFNREKWLILIRPFEPAPGSGREQGLLLVIQIDEGDVPGRLFCGKAAPDLVFLAESTPKDRDQNAVTLSWLWEQPRM